MWQRRCAIILDFDKYVQACDKHLSDKQTENENADEIKQYYEQVNESSLDMSKSMLNLMLQEGFDHGKMSKDEYKAMQPIISGKNSFTESICLFVDYHLKVLATKHDTFLQDNSDFRRHKL